MEPPTRFVPWFHGQQYKFCSANFISLFSKVSEVSGLPRVSPSVRLFHNAEMTERTEARFLLPEIKLFVIAKKCSLIFHVACNTFAQKENKIKSERNVYVTGFGTLIYSP